MGTSPLCGRDLRALWAGLFGQSRIRPCPPADLVYTKVLSTHFQRPGISSFILVFALSAKGG